MGTIVSAHAAVQAAGQVSFATWFWTKADWSSFGTAAFVSLIGGAMWTGWKLRSNKPTPRVLIEAITDAVISFFVGGVAFLAMMIWQGYRGPLDMYVIAGVCWACGLLRGWVLTWAESTVKRVLGAVADGIVGWAASWTSAYLSKRQAGANVETKETL
ncbi:MAG: hypothetical protein V4706_02840 [Pseudomonadota bacterium]